MTLWGTFAFASSPQDSANEAESLLADKSVEGTNSRDTDIYLDNNTADSPEELVDDSSSNETQPQSLSSDVGSIDISAASFESKGLFRNVVAGAQLKPDVTLSLNGKKLSEGVEFELTFDGSTKVPSEAGEYDLVAKGIEKNGYTGSLAIGTYRLVSFTLNSADTYQLVSAANASLVLDASKNPPVSGANVSAYLNNGGKNQTWLIEPDGRGYYIIRNAANTDLVLDASKEKPVSGANVSAYLENGGLNQRWVLVQDTEGFITIHNAASPDLVLDAAKNPPYSGSNISVYLDNGGANQKWSLKNVKDISLSSVSISENYKNYTGTPLSPSVIMTSFNSTLIEGEDFVLLYNGVEEAPTDPGVYEIKVQGIGNFTGSKSIGNFTIYSTFSLSTSEYLITSAANASLVLDASKNPPVSGANVSAYLNNGGKNQTWLIEPDGRGYYIIRNAANTDLVLDASKEKPVSGANVSAYLENGGLNQRWVLVQDTEGFITIHNAASPDLVLDAAKNPPYSGSNISVYLDNGGANQKWSLKSFEEAHKQMDDLAAKNRDTVEDGKYTFYSMLKGHPVVDIQNSSLTDRANVQIESSRALQSQIWEISHDEKGYVQIKNTNSGKYLAVDNDVVASGANVVQCESSAERGSKWVFVKNEDGTFSVRSALFTGLSLDVYKGSNSPGTNVEIYSSLGNDGQKFGLISYPVKVEPCEPILDEDSYFYINSSLDDGLRLDITKGSKDNRANVELWTGSDVMWQMFRFEYVNGFYRIVSANSDKVLDVDGNSLVPDSNVVVYSSCDGADNQLWSVRKNSDETYSFINKKNGLMLEISGGEVVSGANIATGLELPGSSLQSFNLVKVSNLMPVGLYRFTSAVNPEMSLDVTSASISDNANIEIWKSNTSFAQKWLVEHVEGKENTYTLQAVCSGKYLADNGNGNAVQLGSIDENSQWIIRIKGGHYCFINVGTGKALDVHNSGTESGTNVGTWLYHGNDNQLWDQVSVNPVDSGTYLIRSLVNSDMVFDVVSGSTANNANIAMWKFNDGGNQKYVITQNADGTYSIVNCASNKALDVERSLATEGANIIQYTKNNQPNQKWYIEYAADGGFKIESALDRSLLLGFSGESPSNGSEICLVKDSGAKSQHFTFETTTYVPPLPADQQAMLNRIKGNSSGTQWLIAVDRSTHKVGVFRGSANNWSLQYYWSCTTGAPSTPTITGTYRTTGFKRNALTTDSRAIYCTQIWGGYFFHSILASESELGKSLSHGCIRLPYSAAQWIHSNIYMGTTVVIYN